PETVIYLVASSTATTRYGLGARASCSPRRCAWYAIVSLPLALARQREPGTHLWVSRAPRPGNPPQFFGAPIAACLHSHRRFRGYTIPNDAFVPRKECRVSQPTRVWRSELTPLAFLDRSVSVFRDRIAIVDGDRRYSYTEFGQRVWRLAHALRAAGIDAGERVAVLAPNSAAMIEAHFGIPLAGAIIVPINTRLSPDEVAYILDHSGASLLLAGNEFAPLIAEALDRLDHALSTVWLSSTPGGADAPTQARTGDHAYESFLTGARPDPFSWALDPDEGEDGTISINYPRGTTGRPKGVAYHHRGAYLNALGEIITSGLDTDSVYLWTLPLFHCNGWCYSWAVVAAGGTQVCLRAFDAGHAWELIRREGVTNLCGAPTVLTALANCPAAQDGPLIRPLRITTAAAPPSPTIIGRMEALGITITHVYGLTETYGPHTVCAWQPEWDGLPAEDRARLKARQGVAMIMADPIRVVDENMR